MTFNPGETSKVVNIPLCGDGIIEPDENVILTLTGANIGNVLATRDLMADLREADPFRMGGGRPFSKADRSRFLEVLERVIRAANA